MIVDNIVIRKVLGIDIPGEVKCGYLGLVNSPHPSTLTFLDDSQYVNALNANPNITAVFVTADMAEAIHEESIVLIVCDDPRYNFYSLYNSVEEQRYKRIRTTIHPTAEVHSSAHVAEYNVVIGENSKIEANATILPDVIIGSDCIVQAGAVVGSIGYEHKVTKSGTIPVFHGGKVRIGNNVEIGAGCCIDKGFSHRDTIIGSGIKFDNLIHIAHAVHIGANCFIICGAIICGSVTIGKKVWIGPNSTISNGITIGDGAIISIGSVVVKDVGAGERVTGNFAVPHWKFISFIKGMAK